VQTHGSLQVMNNGWASACTWVNDFDVVVTPR
jgi:hypothetical protein